MWSEAKHTAHEGNQATDEPAKSAATRKDFMAAGGCGQRISGRGTGTLVLDMLCERSKGVNSSVGGGQQKLIQREVPAPKRSARTVVAAPTLRRCLPYEADPIAGDESTDGVGTRVPIHTAQSGVSGEGATRTPGHWPIDSEGLGLRRAGGLCDAYFCPTPGFKSPLKF